MLPPYGNKQYRKLLDDTVKFAMDSKEISNIGVLKTRCTVNSKYDKEPIKNYIDTDDLIGIQRIFSQFQMALKTKGFLPKTNNFEFTVHLVFTLYLISFLESM